MTSPDSPPCLAIPIALRFSTVNAMLNAEIADHPVYDGFELQWFDDDTHGTGMLAFLSRSEDRTVDYYADPALRLDPSGYAIGGGTRSWSTTPFESAHLEVAEDGVLAQARFTDVDGRVIEVHVDDRDGHRRRRAGFLAPVSAAIAEPRSLLVVWMPAFDLVRRIPGRSPIVRIDGEDARVGALPGARLHRRHLIKYAAPVCSARLNSDDDVAAGSLGDGVAEPAPGGGVQAVTAACDDRRVTVRFAPPLPDVGHPAGDTPLDGTWVIEVDNARITGGTWSVRPVGSDREVTLQVTQRWRPRRLPLLMRVVTTVVPVFRRWPTTYAWRAVVNADGTVKAAGWSRTGTEDGSGYRRATGS